MKFKEYKGHRNVCVITVDVDGKSVSQPEPKVGEIYPSFDDGKIRLSRLIYWKIVKKIDLDKDKVNKKLLKLIQKGILECYWLYNPEQTVVFQATQVEEDGSEKNDPQLCYFIRTIGGGWFGIGSLFYDSLLDVDKRYYNRIMKEYKESNKRRMC